MQRQTIALLIGATLLLCAGAIVVPQLMTDGDPAPMRWSEQDELEVPAAAQEDAEAESATTGPLERTSVDATGGASGGDEARIDVVLRGRIVDRFQRPVSDASVWLDFGRAGQRGAAASRQRRVRDPVKTDAEGRFAFQGQTFRNLQVSLQVLHEAHAPGLFERDVGEVRSEVDLGDLVLSRGGELVGRVTDLEGNGIVGAELQVQPENANRMRFLRDRNNLLLDFTTDNNGYFRKANLGAGDWSVSATAKRHTEGRSPVFACEDEHTVELEDIRLGPGYEVTGYVRAAQGQPIAKADVRMRSEGRDRGPRGEGARAPAGREHRATTDEGGRFVLDHLPAVPMTLDASAEGHLDYRQEQVDPTLGQPLQVTLQDGLRITGVAIDADGSPVTSFAVRAIRMRGLPVPGQATDGTDLAARLRNGTSDEAARQQVRTLIEDRRNGRGEGQGGQRPGQAARDLGKPEAHQAGEFALTGLQEGIYEVHLQSPDHARFRSQELELRLAAMPPHLTATLDPGVYVAGVVTNLTGAPVRGARVTLRSASSSGTEEGTRRRGRAATADAQAPGQDLEPRGRAFMRQMAMAMSTMEATTDADGVFVLKHAPRGTYQLQAEARGFANATTEPFELQVDRSGFALQLGPLGSLTGSVRGLAAKESTEARVAAVPLAGQNGGQGGLFGRGGGQGGSGNPFNSVEVAADGTYHIDDLVPGDYVVRGWIGSPQELMRELAPRFMDGTLTADVTVRGGEKSQLDVTIVRPQVGIVAGSVLHNGTAGSGFQIDLTRQGEGEATPDRGGRGGGPGGRGGMFGTMGRSFQTAVAMSGQFRIDNVPAGSYRLRVQAGRRGGMLHEEVVQVLADATTERSIVVVTQSLQGTVSLDDGGKPSELNGRVSLLPSLTTLPENLAAWQRENTTFDARLQNGTFRFEMLKAGDYLMVMTIRGRERTTQPIVVGAGSATEIVVPAGKVSTSAAPPGGATATPRPTGPRAR